MKRANNMTKTLDDALRALQDAIESAGDQEPASIDKKRFATETVKRWKARHLPTQFRDVNTRGLDDTTRNEVLRWCSGSNWSITFSGPVGTGKTWTGFAALAGWYYLEILRSHDDSPWCQPPQWISAPELVMRLQSDAGGDVAFARSTYYTLSNASEAVMIDDLGVEKCTEFVRQQINGIIGERNAYARPTIVTTNLTLAQISMIYSDRIASRLAQGCIVEMRGVDMRRHKKIKTNSR